MKELYFDQGEVQEILSGNREFLCLSSDDQNIQIGDHLNFINSGTETSFAEAQVVETYEIAPQEMEERGFCDTEKVLRECERQSMDPTKEVKVVEFRIH